MRKAIQYYTSLLTGIFHNILTTDKSFCLKIVFAGCCLITGSMTANAQDLKWVKGIGGAGTDYSNAVALDGAGNIYVTGYFSQTADFNPGGSGGTLTVAGSTDIFLAKYAPNGDYLWAKSMGGSNSEAAYGIAVDHAGNVFVTGNFTSDTIYFNPGGSGGMLISNGNFDAFIAKYDSAGNYLWAGNMGGTNLDYAGKVSVDGSGNAYVTGYYYQTADFDFLNGGGTLNAVAGGHDIFLAKYDPNGGYLWARSMGGKGTDQGRSVAVDNAGNVYVTGSFNSDTAYFDPVAVTAMLILNRRDDMFVAKYDSSGNYLWAKSMGGSDYDYGYGVNVDGAGNVYVSGYFNSVTAEFNTGGTGGTLNRAGGYDVVIAKYDANGGYLWAKNFGGTGGDFGESAGIDAAGNIYVTGRFSSATADFNPGGSGGTIARAGGSDIFLAKYDPGGNYLWVKGMGGSGTDIGYGVTIGSNGDVYMTGTFNSDTAYFDPGGSGDTLFSEGEFDAFLLKLSCNDSSSSYLTVTECGDGYTLNGAHYTASGIYMQHFPNAAGCDSVVTLDLTLVQFEPVLTVDAFVLGVAAVYASYQWIRNDTDILGATNATYTVTQNGNYQVKVTDENGCEGISASYTVNNVGIRHRDEFEPYISVYPNPVNDIIYINSMVPVNIILTSIEGRSIFQVPDAKMIDAGHLGKGIYLLQITDKEGRLIKTEKVVKE